MDDHQLKQEAFAIFLDHSAQEAVEKNDRIRAANAKDDALWDMMTKIELCRILPPQQEQDSDGDAADEVVHTIHTIDLTEAVPVRETETHVEYALTAAAAASLSMPYDERVRQLRIMISGVIPMNNIALPMSPLEFRVHERTEEDVIFILLGSECFYYDHLVSVWLTGKLTNFTGTVEEIRDEIDSGRARNHYLGMGNIDERRSGNLSPLDGATFTPFSVVISRSTLRPVFNIIRNAANDEPSHGAKQEVLDDLDQLRTLSNTCPNHAGLRQAVEQRPALEIRALALQSTRELAQYLEVICPGTDPIRLSLQDKRWSIDGENGRFTFDPVDAGDTTFPMSRIDDMFLHLGNVPFGGGNHYHPDPARAVENPLQYQFLDGDILAAVRGIGKHKVLARFAFADGWESFAREVLPIGRILDDNDVELAAWPPGLMLRLVLLDINLGVVKKHLDVLGIQPKYRDADEE